MDKHSIEKWMPSYGVHGHWIIFSGNVQIAHIPVPPLKFGESTDPKFLEQQKANIKLMIAAPDLLIALRELVDKCLNSDGYNQKVDELAKAQQAIEKATS